MINFSISVEPLILLFIAAINCEYTLIQYSVSTSHCLSLTNLTDPSICESPKSPNVSALIKDDVTISMRNYNFFLSICCSLATLFTGSWSDYYGRRLPIMFALLSSILAQCLCIIFWITLDHNLIWLIYLAGLVSGISGSSSSLIANCFGYTADITSVQERTKAMTTMQSMLYLGSAIGFSTGSTMVKLFSSSLSIGFTVLLLIHSSLFIYVLCYLKESKSTTDSPTVKGLFRLSHMATVFWTIFHPRPDQPFKRTWLLTVVSCIFLANLISHARFSILYVFLRNDPLRWTSDLYGYLQSANYLIGGFTLLILVPTVQRVYPKLINDDLMATLGFASRTVGLIFLGLTKETFTTFASSFGFIFSELTLPSLRSIVSKTVDTNEKGKAFAFLGLLSNFTFLIGSQLASLVYHYSSSQFPGLIFIILSIISTIPFTIFMIKYFDLINFPTTTTTINNQMINSNKDETISHVNCLSNQHNRFDKSIELANDQCVQEEIEKLLTLKN
ncbi:proton-coupled folate transporter-like [Panonychus citri]|uniref:proton-coupled folate transporter-like n=1 Tax=Panonychus citri TaxID=50023 RepID=UPI002307DFE2|nr:proton-coupled folate transporter-like [Panonychus citri]